MQRLFRFSTALAVATMALAGCPPMPGDMMDVPDPNGAGSKDGGGDPNAGQGNDDDGNDNNNGDVTEEDLAAIQNELDSLRDQLASAERAAMARVYGDGSAGSRVVTGDTRLGDNGDVNLQYEDFTVAAGVTLTVQSGTVLRCTGRFVNNGTIVVQTGGEGASRSGADSSTLADAMRPATQGVASRAAGSGELGGTSSARAGGGEGTGLSEFEGRITRTSAANAGGAGGASFAEGGDGGGAFSVIAGEDALNAGSIIADGESASDGAGGGGGGVIIIAARNQVRNEAGALIAADGGDGGDATASSGPGGAGGGGIIHLIAPEVVDEGASTTAGGAAGASDTVAAVTAAVRSGGGGGGATGGSGGAGGGVSEGADGIPGNADDGQAGFVIQTLADPTALF